MAKIDKLVKASVSAFLMLAQTAMAESTSPDMLTEKCYGVVKAGLNDCATAKASCAGSSTKDNQADAFVFMPKGLCEKLVGGSLQKPSETDK